MNKINIAIDGPAASGKSTTARLLANKLGYIYIDTGAMYRAATLAVLRAGVDIFDEQAVVDWVRRQQIAITVNEQGQHTLLNNEDVTGLIRSSDINKTISVISAYAGVRQLMVEKQQVLARQGGVVMDGRDIGTVVLPAAELKVFMVASLQQRAMRRQRELRARGERMSLAEVMDEIARRDRLDAGRDEAPLKRADDAVELDTSSLTIEQQVQQIYKLAQQVLQRH